MVVPRDTAHSFHSALPALIPRDGYHRLCGPLPYRYSQPVLAARLYEKSVKSGVAFILQVPDDCEEFVGPGVSLNQASTPFVAVAAHYVGTLTRMRTSLSVIYAVQPHREANSLS